MLATQPNKLMVLLFQFPGGASGKESTCQYRRHKRSKFDPWVGKIPWRRKWKPILVFLLGKFHGQGSLATVHAVTKESDTTELASEVQLQQQYSKHLTMVACVSQGNSLSLSPFLPVSPLFPSLSHCYNLKRKKEF